AIGIWYLSDEPDNHNISHHDLKPYYAMIKAASPEIPIAVCHAWTTNWHRYNNVQDILLHDIYPVKESPFPNAKLENQTNFTRAALNQSRDKVTIPVIQFFSWASMSNYTSKRTMDHENNSPRYPTDVEFRYLCLSTIAQ